MSTDPDDRAKFSKTKTNLNPKAQQSIEQKEKKLKKYMEELMRGSEYIRPSKKPNFNPTNEETYSPQKEDSNNNKGAWAEVLERPKNAEYPKSRNNFKQNYDYDNYEDDEQLEDLDEIEDELPNSSQFQDSYKDKNFVGESQFSQNKSKPPQKQQQESTNNYYEDEAPFELYNDEFDPFDQSNITRNSIRPNSHFQRNSKEEEENNNHQYDIEDKIESYHYTEDQSVNTNQLQTQQMMKNSSIASEINYSHLKPPKNHSNFYQKNSQESIQKPPLHQSRHSKESNNINHNDMNMESQRSKFQSSGNQKYDYNPPEKRSNRFSASKDFSKVSSLNNQAEESNDPQFLDSVKQRSKQFMRNNQESNVQQSSIARNNFLNPNSVVNKSPAKSQSKVQSSQLHSYSKRHVSSILNEDYNKKEMYDNLLESVNHVTQVSTNQERKSISEVLEKFYKILMEGEDGMEIEKFEVVLYLINFYQNFIKNLQHETDMEHKEKQLMEQQLQKLANQPDFTDEIFELKNTNQMLKEEVLYQKKKIAILEDDISKKSKDILSITDEHNQVIQKYKAMVDDTCHNYTQAKENEIGIIEKMATLKVELDFSSKENMTLKTEMEEVKNKAKEIFYDNDRLQQELERIKNHMQLMEREKDVFKRRSEEVENHKNAEEQILRQELSNIERMKNKLENGTKELINEVCTFKMENKELQSKVEYLEQMNTLLKQNDTKISQELLKMAGKQQQEKPTSNYRDQMEREYSDKIKNVGNYGLQSQPKYNNNDYSPYSRDEPSLDKPLLTQDNFRQAYGGNSPSQTKAKDFFSKNNTKNDGFYNKHHKDFDYPSNNQSSNRQSSSNNPYIQEPQRTPKQNPKNSKAAGQRNSSQDIDLITGLPKGARAPKDIMNFPAHQTLEMNRTAIKNMDSLLSDFQSKKKFIEAEMCKLPSRPKKIAVRNSCRF